MNEKNIMAICDTQGSYAYRLMEYLEERRALPYRVYAFTAPEKLLDFAEHEEISLLLISEEAASRADGPIPAKRRVVLTDGETVLTEEELRVCKYQPAGEILGQINAYCRESGSAEACSDRLRKKRLVGFYAPSGGAASTLFVIACGQILSERGEALYLSFRNCSGLERLTDDVFSRTLGDLLYYYRRKAEDFRLHMREMTRQIGPLAFLPPALLPSDIQETDAEMWTGFLSRVAEEAEEEILLLEFSDAVRDLPEVLRLCGEIVLVSEENTVAEAALEQFRESLQDRGGAELLARCRTAFPPALDGRLAETTAERAAEGVMGEYAREFFAGEGGRHGSFAGGKKRITGAAGGRRRAFRRRDPAADR